MTIAAILDDFISDVNGQGIVEYGAILAFVSLLVAAVFGFAQGQLGAALSSSLSRMVSEMSRLNTGSGS